MSQNKFSDWTDYKEKSFKLDKTPNEDSTSQPITTELTHVLKKHKNSYCPAGQYFYLTCARTAELDVLLAARLIMVCLRALSATTVKRS
jgi:hypothetical protein